MNVCFGKGSRLGLYIGECPHADLCSNVVGRVEPDYTDGVIGTIQEFVDYYANLLGIGPLICKQYEELEKLEKLMKEKGESDIKEWAGKEMKKLVPYFNENKII